MSKFYSTKEQVWDQMSWLQAHTKSIVDGGSHVDFLFWVNNYLNKENKKAFIKDRGLERGKKKGGKEEGKEKESLRKNYSVGRFKHQFWKKKFFFQRNKHKQAIVLPK